MEEGKLITGFMFLVVGGMNVVKPEILINYQKWISKKLYKAQFQPSAKTYQVQRVFGIIFLLIGFSVLIF